MKIYKVITEADCEGRTMKTLGYCTGAPNDIQAYYEDMKAYNIYLEEISIIHITPEISTGKILLLKQKQELEKQLAFINQQLK